MMTSQTPSRALRALLVFALFAHSMWLFGNLYEEIVFVPNGIASNASSMAAFNAYFTQTKPYSYYVPSTQLGTLALTIGTIVAWRGRAHNRRRWVCAACLSWSAVALTAFIVVVYNTRLWLGDVSQLSDSTVQSLTSAWGTWNLLRILLVATVVYLLFQISNPQVISHNQSFIASSR